MQENPFVWLLEVALPWLSWSPFPSPFFPSAILQKHIDPIKMDSWNIHSVKQAFSPDTIYNCLKYWDVSFISTTTKHGLLVSHYQWCKRIKHKQIGSKFLDFPYPSNKANIRVLIFFTFCPLVLSMTCLGSRCHQSSTTRIGKRGRKKGKSCLWLTFNMRYKIQYSFQYHHITKPF